MTPMTRKYCSKCRIEKCFAIGMRKELLKVYESIDRDRDEVVLETETREDLTQMNENINSCESLPTTDSTNETQLSDENYGQEIDDLLDMAINANTEQLIGWYPIMTTRPERTGRFDRYRQNRDKTRSDTSLKIPKRDRSEERDRSVDKRAVHCNSQRHADEELLTDWETSCRVEDIPQSVGSSRD
ncbi:unnamed protein product, partial [Oppiella nova]